MNKSISVLQGLFLAVFLVISNSLHAEQIISFSDITVNPLQALNYRTTATVHIKWDAEDISREESIAAREAIAVALKSMRVSELTSNRAMVIASNRILNQITQSNVIKSDQIEDIYVTDLVVEYSGKP